MLKKGARTVNLKAVYLNALKIEDPEKRAEATQHLRTEIRKHTNLNWPYAYSLPVQWGGSCLECDNTTGGHYRWCDAVS